MGLSTSQQAELDRIKALNAADKTSTATKQDTPDTSGISTFLQELQNKLIGQTGIVSSADTGLEKVISEAISSNQASREASASRIESRYDKKIADIQQAGQRTLTSAREAQRGFGVNNAALKALKESTEKQVREYEQMKSEALLQNDVQFASQLSNLQLQAYQFQQQAEQQAFNNTLKMAGLGVQIQAEERAASQFQQNLDFQAKQLEARRRDTMLGLATEAGVTLEPGETMESLTKKIQNSPLNKLKKQKLMLEVENLKNEENDQTFDLFANSLMTNSIANGASATEAAEQVINQYSLIYGETLSTERKNQLIKTAILLEQEYKNRVQEDVNNTANVQNSIADTIFNFEKTTGIDFLDKLILERNTQKMKAATGIDMSTLDLSKSRTTKSSNNLPYGGKELSDNIGETIYNNLFGESFNE